MAKANRPTKPKAAPIKTPEGSGARDIWKKLREAVSKATKEDLEAPKITNRLPTGITFLDAALGEGNAAEGGLPGGRAVMIHGAEGTLKSTFLDMIGAQAQRRGGFYWKANPEDSHNDKLFKMVGASEDPTQFMYTRPLNIEEWLLSLDKFLGSGITDVDVPVVIGLDTLAMLSPKKEGENDIRHSGLPMGTPGKLAQYFRSTDALKRLSNTNIYLIILQQHRDQAGGGSYGPPIDKVPGGRSLRHYLSTRIEMSLVTKTEAEDKAGIRLLKEDDAGKKFFACTKFTMHKLRDEIGGRTAYVPYSYRAGWLDEIACFDFLKHHHFLEQSGNYTRFNEMSKYHLDWYKEITKPESDSLRKVLKEMGGQAYYQEMFDQSAQEDKIL